MLDEEEPDEADVLDEPESLEEEPLDEDSLDEDEALSEEEPFDEPEELVIAELSEVLALSVR